MSDRSAAGPAYRATRSASAAPLVARCLCFGLGAALRALFFLGFTMIFVISGFQRTGEPLLLIPLAVGVYLALRQIPLLTLRADVVDGDVVVTGCRWPGPDATWSCGLHEVAGFELETHRDGQGVAQQRVSLRTTDGQLLGLTEKLYPQGERALRAVAARLNSWLEPLRRA
jgi:Na+-transporting methylmalonyl-CoA/oxaloacetate decarboxylase beta subunit